MPLATVTNRQFPNPRVAHLASACLSVDVPDWRRAAQQAAACIESTPREIASPSKPLRWLAQTKSRSGSTSSPPVRAAPLENAIRTWSHAANVRLRVAHVAACMADRPWI